MRPAFDVGGVGVVPVVVDGGAGGVEDEEARVVTGRGIVTGVRSISSTTTSSIGGGPAGVATPETAPAGAGAAMRFATATVDGGQAASASTADVKSYKQP